MGMVLSTLTGLVAAAPPSPNNGVVFHNNLGPAYSERIRGGWRAGIDWVFDRFDDRNRRRSERVALDHIHTLFATGSRQTDSVVMCVNM